MTEGDAAPAAPAEQGSRNLLMRVLAAVVLAPVAIAIAWAGGWLWALLVTLAAIGLYVEWLAIVGLARELRATLPGVAALAIGGIGLISGRLDAALIVLATGFVAVALLSPERRNWSATGFLYAAAAETGSVLVRQDAPHVISFFREAPDLWREAEVRGLDAAADLKSVGLQLALQSIYRKVEF